MTLSSAVAVFQINNREAGELFFSMNNFIISPPHFGVKISEMAGGGVAGHFCMMTHQELRGLAMLLGYNPVTFHPDRTFSS